MEKARKRPIIMNTPKGSRRSPNIKSDLKVREDDKSLERSEAELKVPDPSAEHAKAVLRGDKKDEGD